jgi:two-component system response regulator YesN
MKDVSEMYQILVVDDEKDERAVVTFLLKKNGFPLTVYEAENGQAALDFLKKQRVDILFTDVRMPFLYGTELAAQARKLYPEIQILFFSGYDDFSYAKKAITLGAVGYILKPIHQNEFEETMRSTLQTLEKQIKMRQNQSLVSVSLRNHILSRLLNGANEETLNKEYSAADLSFLKEYHRLFLIEFDTDSFDRYPQNFF